MNKRQRTRARLAIHRITMERRELFNLLCPIVHGEPDYSLITVEQAEALDKIKEGYDILNDWARSLPI